MMASSSAGRIMEKPGQEQLQQQQQALKCPRCDSSNTKFCYYNNYSLSQPRHFCKACKRYWTRGGTLRNVPVGGGCRKNKRVKRPNNSSSSSSLPDHHHHSHNHNSSSSSSSPSSLLSSNPASSVQPQIDLSSNHHNHISPLFYGLANNAPNSDILSLQFSRFMSSTTSGYDLVQPQLNNVLGLGFSSGINNTTDYNGQNGFNSNSTSLLSSYSSIFSTPSSSPSPTIASLFASKFTNGGRGSNHFPSLSSPFEEVRITGNNGESEMGLMKQVKLENGQRRLDWNGIADENSCAAQNHDDNHHQTVEQSLGLSSSSDPSLNYWSINPTAVGGANWHDPGSLGSSVPSLI